MHLPLRHYSLGFVFSEDDMRMHARAIADADKFMADFGRGHSPHLVRNTKAYYGSSLLK